MKSIVRSCIIITLLSLLGCSQATGPKTMHVWGDVWLDGKPVEEGSITFESPEGLPPAQAPIRAGHYDLPAEVGPLAEKSYIIRFSALMRTGKTITNVMGDGAPTMDVMVEMIPNEFNRESTVKKTISPDPAKNQLNFKLHKSGSLE
jgi:hypothetical protein